MPRLLTVDQKRIQINVSKEYLDMFVRNLTDFLRRFIIVDETWIHHYTKDETTIETMARRGWKCSEEGENSSISRKDDSFLGFS